ncbi:MAG: glycosyltransferase [Desulfohalobiaceae bacterium]|nr:glycosyltransferase [Desulfohalobiaceae bacterium]
MKILHLINDLGYGGAQKVLLELAKSVDRNRFQFSVGLWGSGWGSELIPKFRDLGLEVVDFQARTKFDPRALWALYRYLRRESIDILHTHLMLMHVMGRMAGKLAGVPRIVSTHHNLAQSNHPLSRTLERLTRPLSKATVFVSLAVQTSYGFPDQQGVASEPSRHTVIYNPVSMRKLQQDAARTDLQAVKAQLGLRQSFVFSCIGRLHASKGQAWLLEAVDRLRRNHSEFQVLVAGDGPLRTCLEEKTTGQGLEDHIKFLGFRDDVAALLAASDCFVIPPVFEGFGLAQAEAMALGLPVISTNLPAIAEVVQHGETGLLVPPEDADALAEAMDWLMDHPQEAERMGRKAQKRVEALFSSQVIARQYATFYQDLLTG